MQKRDEFLRSTRKSRSKILMTIERSDQETALYWKRHLFAGAVAGAISRSITAPLDRIKIYFQVYTSETRVASCVRNLYAEGGLRGFWRGNGVNILKIAPESAMKFAANEWLKDHILDNTTRKELTLLDRFTAGSAAGSVAQSSVYPLEVLKTRLALGKTREYSGVLDATRKLYLNEGIKTFYRGFVPNLLGIVPYAGIEIAVYESLRNHFQQKQGNNGIPNIWASITYGIAAAGAGQAATYPLSLVKTRLMAQTVQQIGTDRSKPTMLGMFTAIARQDGVRGLYRGLSINLVKVCPAVSTTYAVLETLRHMLGVTSI